MTMNSLFASGAKPIRTLITTGTGNWVPSVDNALCRVRLQAGGGGGWSAGGSSGGGGGGEMLEFWVRVPIAGKAYVVGAGGVVITNGSSTSFGNFLANPGGGASAAATPGFGGFRGLLRGSVNATAATMSAGNTLAGVSGGHGGYNLGGGQVGFPICNDGSGNYTASPAAGLDPNNGIGAYCGGDSFYGKGATTGNSPATDAYGAGGGPGASGRGGCIEIEDFGA